MKRIEYIHHCGDDLTVVNAARVSFNKNRDKLSIGDIKLINYLAQHKHFSPFNHCFFTFRINAPIFVARQLVKHEYLVWNEVSRRYVDDPPEYFTPEFWRHRSEDKKQGSLDVAVKDNNKINEAYNLLLEASSLVYNKMIESGVAPEQARMSLPQSTMTQWYWSGTVKAFAKMYKLRVAEDSQKETQDTIKPMGDMIGARMPYTWAALMEANLD